MSDDDAMVEAADWTDLASVLRAADRTVRLANEWDDCECSETACEHHAAWTAADNVTVALGLNTTDCEMVARFAPLLAEVAALRADLAEEQARVTRREASLDEQFGVAMEITAERDAARAEVAALRGERDRLVATLERIAELPSGAIPGHAVAIGCRHNIVAYKALHAPTETECADCDGRGYSMDYGPWKMIPDETSSTTWSHQGKSGTIQGGKPSDEKDPDGVSWGKRIACSSCDATGWRAALAPEPCEHLSSTGVDEAPDGPEKVWRCAACGWLYRSVPQGDGTHRDVPVAPEPEGRGA